MKLIAALFLLIGLSLDARASSDSLKLDYLSVDRLCKEAYMALDPPKRSPSKHEWAIMHMMLADSIDIYYGYLPIKNLAPEDMRLIYLWERHNMDILDEEIVNSSIRFNELNRKMSYQPNILNYKSEFYVLTDNLAARLKRRREAVDKKLKNGNFENDIIENVIDDFRNSFGENDENPSPIRSISLSFDDKLFIDAINVLNGSPFIYCEDMVLDVSRLDKLKDWWWANKGNISEEEYMEAWELCYRKAYGMYDEKEWIDYTEKHGDNYRIKM